MEQSTVNSPGQKATAFHKFSSLPCELRTRIWELTVEPRTVDVHLQLDEGPHEVTED